VERIMARVTLITENGPHLDSEQSETFDWVVESRGKMIRPFEVLLHTPDIARSIAELGAKIRFSSTLPDADRELVILTVGVTHGCAFVWDSHIDLARSVGVRPEALEALSSGEDDGLGDHELLLISASRSLCRSGGVSDAQFAGLVAAYGERGAVDYCATVGYYTMLGFVMGATEAC
jgi:4-carboxymuconolactone decarboxylase